MIALRLRIISRKCSIEPNIMAEWSSTCVQSKNWQEYLLSFVIASFNLSCWTVCDAQKIKNLRLIIFSQLKECWISEFYVLSNECSMKCIICRSWWENFRGWDIENRSKELFSGICYHSAVLARELAIFCWSARKPFRKKLYEYQLAPYRHAATFIQFHTTICHTFQVHFF